MSKPLRVTKRDGTKAELDLDKFHKVVNFACEDLSGVSPSEIEMKSHIQFYDGITTSEIQETLIKSASELISEDCPNYQFVAGKLINYHLRKSVYGKYAPDGLYEHYQRVLELGYYDDRLHSLYSKEEFDLFDSQINHERDWTLTYAAMEQFRGKYLVQDRVTKTHFETPQMSYMLIAMTLFSAYPKETRSSYVRRFYNCASTHKISLPTPIMSGCRTDQRQFSSCVLIECGDSLKSINATATSIIDYVSKKAGIGIGGGAIRAVGSPIRNGDAVHTGVIPFYKHFQSAVKSCSQGGVRGGSATLYYPIWHKEVEDMLVLKNNRGTEFNRVRQMDYGVQFSELFYERLINNENITLFSPSDVPGLYEAFYSDQNKFKALYEKAERSRVDKISVPALDLFTQYIQERKDTGRIYLQNVDNVNLQGPFKPDLAPIRQSNLCLTGDSLVDVKINGEYKFNVRLDSIYDRYLTDIEILSYCEDTRTNVYRKITKGALMNPEAQVMEIEDDATGKKIRCTPDHKIYTINRGWVMAKDLNESDTLKLSKQSKTSPGEGWVKGRKYGY